MSGREIFFESGTEIYISEWQRNMYAYESGKKYLFVRGGTICESWTVLPSVIDKIWFSKFQNTALASQKDSILT